MQWKAQSVFYWHWRSLVLLLRKCTLIGHTMNYGKKTCSHKNWDGNTFILCAMANEIFSLTLPFSILVWLLFVPSQHHLNSFGLLRIMLRFFLINENFLPLTNTNSIMFRAIFSKIQCKREFEKQKQQQQQPVTEPINLKTCMQYTKPFIDFLMRHNCYRLLKTNSLSDVVVAVCRSCPHIAPNMLIKSGNEWLQAFRFIFNQWKPSLNVWFE